MTLNPSILDDLQRLTQEALEKRRRARARARLLEATGWALWVLCAGWLTYTLADNGPAGHAALAVAGIVAAGGLVYRFGNR